MEKTSDLGHLWVKKIRGNFFSSFLCESMLASGDLFFFLKRVKSCQLQYNEAGVITKRV